MKAAAKQIVCIALGVAIGLVVGVKAVRVIFLDDNTEVSEVARQ